MPISGTWWVSKTACARIPGALSRAGTDWQLDLIGTLPITQSQEEGLALSDLVTIHGFCHGQHYTLQGCSVEITGGPSETFEKIEPGEPGDDQNWMRCSVQTVLRGHLVFEGTLYEQAAFQLIGLEQWWPLSGFKGAVSDEYEAPPGLDIVCHDDTRITITARDKRSQTDRSRTLTESVVVTARRKDGFTLDWLQANVITPLRALVAIGLQTPSGVSGLRLVPRHEHGPDSTVTGRPSWADVVEAQPARTAVPGRSWRRPPALAPGAETMSAFIPTWIHVARTCAVALDAVETRLRHNSLQGQLLEAVNAAETLQRQLHPDPGEFRFAEQVRQALSDAGGFTSAQRRRVRDAVKFTEMSLEQRLRRLVEGMGPGLSGWLFHNGGSADSWALCTATVRNVLSHGFTPRYTVHTDPAALIAMTEYTRLVITLRLMAEAGLSSDASLIARMDTDGNLRHVQRQRLVDWDQLARDIGSRR
ncbi:HEPN domain-containing protein [Streptomyces sp. NPDC056353]|uniref:ApeA N-terminal domain 1-containing protein n=1 Tax=Streptomyces sp. NPDC056353 TaxID=3345792 RepID=UPI0035E3A6DF